MKKWKCSVCGYEFAGDDPEKCPACGAASDKLEEAGQSGDVGGDAVRELKQEAEDKSAKAGGEAAEKKWRCTVCNYIHTGAEPPDPCPVCGADSSFFVEVTEDEKGDESSKAEEQQERQPPPKEAGGTTDERPKSQAAEKASSPKKPKKSDKKEKETKPFGALGALVMHFHLHPISVHIPNGVLPVAALFMVLAMLIGYTPLETASFFNFIVVLLAMPLVFATGFIAWQRKFNGALTSLFKTKLICTAVVTASVALLVIYRLVDPTVALTEGSGRWVYLILVGVALVAATIAGSLGGRLVFRK